MAPWFTIAAFLSVYAAFQLWGWTPWLVISMPPLTPQAPVYGNAPTIHLGGIEIPNALPAGVAVLLAIWAWVGIRRPGWTLVPIVYGLLHLSMVGYSLIHRNGSVASGWTLSVVAYLLMLGSVLGVPLVVRPSRSRAS